MGRQIVLESHRKPGKRSRLWSFEDLLHVLKKDTEAEALQAIVLNRYEWETQDWRNFETFPDAFSKMSLVTNQQRQLPPPRGRVKSKILSLMSAAFKVGGAVSRLHEQSSRSQPWSQKETRYETSITRKEDGFGIAFQTIIPGYEIPWWITHQRLGNSISIELPPNWCNSRWMGFALSASLDASYSHISVEEFDLIGKTFGLKARVIALGDMPHCYYATEISFSTKLVARHIWLLYLSRDDWFATAQSGEFNQIVVVFESSRPGLFVRKCGLSLVYKQDVEMFTQTMCSSNRITLEGFDDYNDNEPGAICSSSEEIEKLHLLSQWYTNFIPKQH
ncbi:hypothetical protein CMV_026929 [Castanea mollissima]|uniref:C-JID domain-containing protein n=1 Tax=Castanea mollissima TaxID=60419 RepID=A0A8J4QJ99_9ROSI|nr:hypothetical protein CMV_026929 [Castanea mollissima]